MKSFKNILCVIEPGKKNKHALEHAVTLTKNNTAGLTVIDVVERVTAYHQSR